MNARALRVLLAVMPPLSVLVASAACTARRHEGEPASPMTDAASEIDGGAEILSVPKAPAVIRPTGHFDVKLWGASASTRTLLDSARHGAVPVSEARFLWGDGQLYVFFYAGDLDLQAHTTKHDGAVWKDDSVALTFFSADGMKRIIQVSPKGVVADGVCPLDASDLGDPRCDKSWESGIRVAADFDGTFNDVHGFDEEWAIEAAVPLASLSLPKAGPGARIPLRVSRCEVAYDGVKACGAWGSAREGGILAFEDH